MYTQNYYEYDLVHVFLEANFDKATYAVACATRAPGKRNPSILVLDRSAFALGVDIGDLDEAATAGQNGTATWSRRRRGADPQNGRSCLGGSSALT